MIYWFVSLGYSHTLLQQLDLVPQGDFWWEAVGFPFLTFCLKETFDGKAPQVEISLPHTPPPYLKMLGNIWKYLEEKYDKYLEIF